MEDLSTAEKPFSVVGSTVALCPSPRVEWVLRREPDRCNQGRIPDVTSAPGRVGTACRDQEILQTTPRPRRFDV